MLSPRYHELKQRGSVDFPLEYHYIDHENPRYEMPYHWHEETEILYMRSGSFSLSLDGETTELHPGEAAFIASGCLHGGIPHDCVYECIVFDLNMMLNAPGLCREKMGEITGRKIQIRKFFAAGDPLVRRFLCPMFDSLHRQDDGCVLSTYGLLYAFFGGIFSAGAYQPEPNDGNEGRKMLQLKAVFDLIENRYTQKLTLDDLASSVHLDRKYFCRFFKQATHMTPMQYLQYYRIEQACYEMQVTDRNITEIALNVGFTSPEYFTRVFRKLKGIVPGQYISQLRCP